MANPVKNFLVILIQNVYFVLNLFWQIGVKAFQEDVLLWNSTNIWQMAGQSSRSSHKFENKTKIFDWSIMNTSVAREQTR